MAAEEALALLIQPDWHADAACRSMSKKVFFPENAKTLEQDREIAKRVCANCPVRRPCRDGARERGEEWGIWGGEDEDERLAKGFYTASYKYG